VYNPLGYFGEGGKKADRSVIHGNCRVFVGFREWKNSGFFPGSREVGIGQY
jgi:hypothetical protein